MEAQARTSFAFFGRKPCILIRLYWPVFRVHSQLLAATGPAIHKRQTETGTKGQICFGTPNGPCGSIVCFRLVRKFQTVKIEKFKSRKCSDENLGA